MRTCAPAVFALLLLVACGVLVACGDREKKSDCEKLTPFLHGAPTSDCGKESTPSIKRPTPSDVSDQLAKEAATLRALDVKTPDLRARRDELAGYHEKERDLCREYASTTDAAKRISLKSSMDDIASTRRGLVEGAKFGCDQVLHPGHL